MRDFKAGFVAGLRDAKSSNRAFLFILAWSIVLAVVAGALTALLN